MSRSKVGIYLGKSLEHARNASLILDPTTNFISPQFRAVHINDFASVLRKRVDVLTPDWNKLFKFYDKVTEDDLINSLLQVTLESERDKLLKVKVRFDHDETVIRPNDDPLIDLESSSASAKD